jgi:serine/threonine protein kinase
LWRLQAGQTDWRRWILDVNLSIISRVYLGIHKVTKKKVAVKIIRQEIMQSLSGEEIKKEVSLLEELDHPR